MKNKAAIITVNWDGKKFLKNCLSSLYKQTYKNFDVYFVDNGSIDNSIEFVKKNFPKTKIIRLDKNYGFAKGYNEGIKEVLKDKSIEYIICLNNDTIVDKNWLKSLIEKVDYDKKIDMVSSQSCFPNGKIQTIGLKFEKNLIGNKIGGLSIGYGEKAKKHNKPLEVYCPSGVSALYTRRLLEDVGLFDEDFFAYAEDLDLGMRARRSGYKCIYSPKSKLIHLHSQTSGGIASPLKAYLIKRNSYFVAIKNFNFVDLMLFPSREFFWNIKSLFEKNKEKSVNKLKNKIGLWGIIMIIFKTYLMVFIYMPKMLFKRFHFIEKQRKKPGKRQNYNIGILIHEHKNGGSYIMSERISKLPNTKLVLLSSNRTKKKPSKKNLRIRTIKLLGKRILYNPLDIFSIDRKISLWHINYPSPLIIPLFIFSRKPKIVSFHFMLSRHPFCLSRNKGLNDLTNKFFLNPFYKFIVNIIILFSNKITFITKAQLKEYSKGVFFKYLLEKKSIVINNFIEEDKIIKSKKQYPNSVIFVGNLEKAKGFDDLLKVINSLKRLIKFTIIGRGKLESHIPKDKNITYIKSVDSKNILKYYDQSSIFILPSYTEVFPVTITEAMARGLVILVSKIPGMEEIVKEDKNGYLFSPGDLNEIKKIILYLKKYPKEIKRISINNLKDIWKFAAEKKLLEYAKIYKELLKNKND